MSSDDGDTFLGEYVYVIRTDMNGKTHREWLPVLLAVDSVGYDEDNGVKWSSARIYPWGGIDLGPWDRSA